MLIIILLESLELGLIYSILALGVFLSFRTLNTPDLTVDGSIVTGAAISAVICSRRGRYEPAYADAYVHTGAGGFICAGYGSGSYYGAA